MDQRRGARTSFGQISLIVSVSWRPDRYTSWLTPFEDGSRDVGCKIRESREAKRLAPHAGRGWFGQPLPCQVSTNDQVDKFSVTRIRAWRRLHPKLQLMPTASCTAGNLEVDTAFGGFPAAFGIDQRKRRGAAEPSFYFVGIVILNITRRPAVAGRSEGSGLARPPFTPTGGTSPAPYPPCRSWNWTTSLAPVARACPPALPPSTCPIIQQCGRKAAYTRPSVSLRECCVRNMRDDLASSGK